MRPVTLQTLSDRSRSVAVLFLLAVSAAFGQQAPPADDSDKPAGHVLWVIPNFRTTPEMGAGYKPITVKEKFKIAQQDTFDRGTFALAAVFAAGGQLQNTERSFGQGVKGYAHYWATEYADYAMGNYMTEAIFPSLLHQDPRYFRRGHGSGFSRLGSAVGQIFWTRSDSGRHMFNFSEFAGNSTAVAISMSYYPGSRTAGDAATQLGTQVAVDMAANIVKEFWPSRSRKSSKPSADAAK
jgi:hypothetical protein